MSFPPPEEMKGDWEYVKELIDRLRKPRSQLRSSELALLMDVGDYCLQQRALETADLGERGGRVRAERERPDARVDEESHSLERFVL